jgi:iron complex transport system substrate-binding protein
MVFLLGLDDALVGVTDACNHPPAAKRVPIVGSFGRPNVEVLLAARPSLVVTSGLRPGPATEALRNSGARILDLEMHSFDDLFAGLRRLGAAAGAPEKGRAAASRLAAALEAASGRFATLPEARRPRVFVEIGEAPLTTAGGPSFINEVIRRAGGVNVARKLARAYVHVNPEMVVAWDPDVILLGRMAPHDAAREALARRIGWGKVAAVRNGRVIGDIHPDLLLRPGPRLVEGVRALAARLHVPEAGER